ncbi:ricin-type beta-trefoil lectin domain protein [Streptomyces luteireticuli]|uniref:Glycoside hydrolase family 16 protein n=1 Tax=Streptomyces luteireticuli TaxID=173858 RepID=A0ABN0YMJ0_9ACTN
MHLRIRPSLRAAALAVTALAALAAATPANAATDAKPRSRAVAAAVFADEFDGPAGSGPDASKWQNDVGGGSGGWGNGELEYYTSGNNNAKLDGRGHLVVEARRENPGNYQCWYGRCEYTSARLNTAGRYTAQYGRAEARMKIPAGQGMWPAFWMLGNDIGSNPWPNSGELDVMENVGFEPGTVHGSLHGPGYSGGSSITGTYTLPGGQKLSDDFHTYAVDWAPDSITWSIDGTVYQRRTPADLGGKPWVFNKPFFLILNLAVGGNWPGSPNGATQFPARMVVDHVRVTTSNGPSGALKGLDGKCLDVPGGNTGNGTPVQIWGCNGGGNQKWTIGDDGTVKSLGKCLDANTAGTSDGTKVQLWDCNGTAAQKWSYNAAHDVVNVNADKCLDITGNNSADGTPTQLWTCTGKPNQKWNLAS